MCYKWRCHRYCFLSFGTTLIVSHQICLAAISLEFVSTNCVWQREREVVSCSLVWGFMFVNFVLMLNFIPVHELNRNLCIHLCFSWKFKVTVRRCQWWRLWDIQCESVKSKHPQTRCCWLVSSFTLRIINVPQLCPTMFSPLTGSFEVDQKILLSSGSSDQVRWTSGSTSAGEGIQCIYWTCT